MKNNLNNLQKMIFLAIIFFGFFGLARSSEAADVIVNQYNVRQKIQGFGGNYAFGQSGSTVGQYTLNNLKPAHVRVEIKLAEWEPVNDNSDFNNFNWSAFQNVGNTNANFIQMQNFKNKGIPITASVWNAPNWMVSNPDNSSQRVIPIDKYDEAIESIAAYLLFARDQYGVEIQYVSFNEADGGYKIIFTSAQMASFIKKAGARFSALGLNTKWLTGDTSNAGNLVSYAAPILQDATARQYLGPVSFHSWNSWSSGTMENIYTLAREYGLPVWCEEVGTNPAYWQTPSVFPTWNYALEIARIYHFILRHSGAEILDYWEYGNDYPLVSNENVPYPSYYIIKQLADNFPIRTDIIETSSNDSEVLALAGKNSSGYIAVHLINTSYSAKTVSLSGATNGNYTLIRTSAAEKMQNIGTYAAEAGSLTLNLPASSVSVLVSTDFVPTPNNLTVRTKGTLAGSAWPNMEIWVDGVKITNTTVSSSAYTDYNFSIATDPQKIDVVFTNDYYDPTTGADRNLFVDYITINGKTIQAESPGVILDKGDGSAAFDGIDTIPGQEAISWNAALRFAVSTDTTPPASPTGLTVL